MKEIGMEKLIELLNEWERERVNHNMKEFIPYGKSSFSDLSVERIISKKYGFIKQLVENDKIDTNNLSLKAFKNIFSGGGFVEVSDLEVLLMLLAISDTPIEDLISYLK